MGNADANEQFFADERRRLVQQICDSVNNMHGESVRKAEVLEVIGLATLRFEKEIYNDGDNERER